MNANDVFFQHLSGHPDPASLLDALVHFLCGSLRVTRGQVVVRDSLSGQFVSCRIFPEAPASVWPADSPLAPFFETTRAGALHFGPLDANSEARALELAARKALKESGHEVCLPFFAREQLIGFLVLGGKTAGQPHSPQDLHALTVLARPVGLFLDHLLRQHERELLGQVSSGLAHDLQSLLTSVDTVLQLSANAAERAKVEALLPVARKNLTAALASLRQARTPAVNAPAFRRVSLNALLERVAGLAEDDLRARSLAVVIHAPEVITSEVDEILMLRLVHNLLANAIGAAPAGSQIRLELFRVSDVAGGRDWARVSVGDAGAGMGAEKLQRLNAPVIPMKSAGETGLGLLICRQIVAAHGGRFRLESEPGRGTRALVDLPLGTAASKMAAE